MTRGRGEGRPHRKVPLSPETLENHTWPHKQNEEEEQLEDEESLDITKEKVMNQEGDEEGKNKTWKP